MEEKHTIQEWLKDIPFSHFITVEPTPSLPFTKDEIVQRMRILEFRLNKTYLKSNFPKWDANNRFWMVGFREGDGVAHQVHYHILLHSPSVLHRKTWYANVSADLQVGWMMMPSRNPYSGMKRQFCRDGKPTLNIQTVESITAAAIYCSKWMNRIEDGGGYFFTTPSNQTPIRVAA
tara:strand:+ start:171 stop:698 length:528 start_codon:yes stop_codon:yes gene_type:complete